MVCPHKQPPTNTHTHTHTRMHAHALLLASGKFNVNSILYFPFDLVSLFLVSFHSPPSLSFSLSISLSHTHFLSPSLSLLSSPSSFSRLSFHLLFLSLPLSPTLLLAPLPIYFLCLISLDWPDQGIKSYTYHQRLWYIRFSIKQIALLWTFHQTKYQGKFYSYVDRVRYHYSLFIIDLFSKCIYMYACFSP